MTTRHHLSPALQALLALAAALAFSSCIAPGHGLRGAPSSDAAPTDESAIADHPAAPLLVDVRQLTFEGRRSGEGYFSRDGSLFIFQSERQANNPFYQIYLLDFGTGRTWRVSPGVGKTTCGWIHPSGTRLLFSSTHLDRSARDKQREELGRRFIKGADRRYAWDYDENFDIFEADLRGRRLKNLTGTLGYDAEGSWSPDGERIVFASNRRAYSGVMTAEEQTLFDRDKSYMLDIYSMKADGTDVRQLTDAEGADGGPFFSPDGTRIVWRRFSKDGRRANVFTMNADGTEARQITHLDAVSWAPYYHPSGDYLIFATNRDGASNFELYLVDGEGRSDPIRVTYDDAFDGLPVFSPDGRHLTWASTRTAKKQAQIFIADWNDSEARRRIGLAETGTIDPSRELGPPLATPELGHTAPDVVATDLRMHITYLASEMMDGRLTGSDGERRATEYVASVLKSYGLEPAGDGRTFFQNFEFTAGVSLGPDNRLALSTEAPGAPELAVDLDWRPLAFSKSGHFDAAEVVFAGYGIVAPANGVHPEYDSYAGLDVEGKWALVFRYLPEKAKEELRHHLSQFAGLRYKAMVARDRGARGLIIVSGPNSGVKDQLVKLSFDASLGGTSLGALSITDRVAELLLKPAEVNLQRIQDDLDGGEARPGFEMPSLAVAAQIDIREERRTGRNVLARLNAGGNGQGEIVVGAHVDHLGEGSTTATLARSEEEGMIHYGADDNAAGVAAVLEIAEYLASQRIEASPVMHRSVFFALWSGEELGLLGSSHFAKTFGGAEEEPTTLAPAIAAYLNMDMIGRLKKRLVLLGVGSSSVWPTEIKRANAGLGIPIVKQNTSYLPTDATPFYVKGVPILSAFTGAHRDYHTPRDTADKINYAGTEKITRLMARITASLATAETIPDYVVMEKPGNAMGRANLRAYLGTIPDYASTDVVGVRLSGVAKGGPADRAGLRAGDTIVDLAGRKIENIYDYTFALGLVKIGVAVPITVMRGGERVTMSVTPASRE